MCPPRMCRTTLQLAAMALLLIGISSAQASNSTARFAVIGDYGGSAYWGTPDPPGATRCVSDMQCESAVATLVHSWNPDFIITTGDNNYEVGGADTIDQNIGQYYHDFIFPYKGDTGRYGGGATTNRFFPSLGNHDWINCYAGTDPNCKPAGPYLNYFTLPDNERYYELARGPVHLFAIDSSDEYDHEPDGKISTSKQAKWLQDRLAASTEPWNLVFFHHPPYSSGSWWVDWMRWPFQAWGATAVLSG